MRFFNAPALAGDAGSLRMRSQSATPALERLSWRSACDPHTAGHLKIPSMGRNAKLSDRFLFTSESVTEGHPDKIADQVSDAILDACLEQDPYSRVAAETLTATGLVVIAGDIAQGVDTGGAGDQGMMFGYASNETPELMPAPISLAHKLCRQLAKVRKSGRLPYLRPDGKSQVTVEYDENGKPARIDAVVISSQHSESISNEELHADILKYVIQAVLPAEWLDEHTKYHINPTGRFVIGGPMGDTGLTGRKIIVDTYGGMGRHGGGAFSGKDPTKVDRSAAYMARYIAKNIVAAGLAERAEVALAYAIGVAEPVSVRVDTFGTGKIGETTLTELVRKNFSLTPKGIIESLNLRRPIYQKTAAYGHFGRSDADFTWERTDKAEALREGAKTAKAVLKVND